ncbi:SDR family NAD(P)-dependent oxidoreductase [Stigmatella erecta]|uniref:KR domain-containing protein n=1 Tax=Stigmatella erecta TaxID=83460 RepID=A0A1I0KWZ7_9BACT|nr:SDR family NAD(P)-dependent oxidoreductase [Stigmatella erecta]SEU30498.1 KR domain-containing protein [Stigmatella erecta]
MRHVTLEAIQEEVTAALAQGTGYLPELFGREVDLVNGLGMTRDELQGAVAAAGLKLGLSAGLPDSLSQHTTIERIARNMLELVNGGASPAPSGELTLEQVLAFVDGCAQRNERPVLETLLTETSEALARLEAAAGKAPEPVRSAPVSAASPAQVMTLLVKALVERTGYPEDMLEPELDLEADLGIDTVKQVEAFAMARVSLGVEKDENFRLRDHNTLRKMVDYLVPRSLGSAPATAPAPQPAAAPASVEAAAVLEFLRQGMAGKSGYGLDVLQPDLDLEVDLGIDTITQIEVFALAREHYGVERDEDFRVRHYNTLRKMAEYLVARASGSAPTRSAAAPAQPDAVMKMLISALVERTGYPEDMLEPDLDLEADLGIDTVKQVEAFAMARVALGVEKDENFRLRDHNTLRKMVAYLSNAAPSAVAPVEAAPAPAPGGAPGAKPEAVMALLVKALVERTGYPEDMLEPELDLEADLGIDTVKQVEAFAMARVSLGVEKDENFRLRDHNTLRKMVDYLVRGAAGSTAAPAPEAAPASPSAGEEEVQAFLVSVLQEKTGYSTEIIQPDLDMEVELGIDTVTQIEAFALTREKFGVPRNEDFRIRDHNTVRKMSAYLAAHLPNAGAAPQPPASPQALPPAAAAKAMDLEAVRRFVAQCEAKGDVESLRKLAAHLGTHLRAPAPQPLTPPAQMAGQRYEVHPVALGAQVRPENIAHLKGKTLGITTDAQGAYKALAQKLEAAGARVVLLHTGPAPAQGMSLDWKQPETAGSRLKELQASQPLDGLILLHTTAAAPKLAGLEAAEWASSINTFTLGLYYSGVAVYDRINAIPGGGWYLVATAGGGLFGHANAQGQVPLAGAVGGFIKCLKRELPGSRCKALDLDPQDAQGWAEQVWTELVSADPDIEVGYSGGRRFVFRDIPTPLAAGKPALSIRPGAVVVVSGGGRGVVYHSAKRLSQATGARVIVTGRTVPPAGHEEWLKVPAKELPAYQMGWVRRYLAEHAGSTPVQARRAFESGIAYRRELHQNLEDCRAQGIPLEYKVCDMTDVQAVRALLAGVRQQYGRIDGIVHGATIEESKSLPRKTADVFVRTLNAKAHLWQLLVQETWKDDLQFFISFGSGSGRYGNKGQTSYSAANALIAKAGLVYGTLRPGVRSVTVDWPVWVGAGIVENNADYLERLSKLGVCVIDIAEGAYWFTGEILHGGSAGETVIADDKTFESVGWPRHGQDSLQVTAREAGGTRYAL